MGGIQNYGGLITIVGINLVVCGAVLYYFHKRLHSLEQAILKQNQAFTAFMMTEIQREVNRRAPAMNNPSNLNDLAAPEAVAAVSKIITLNKIAVSDDSSASSESDSTSSDEEEATSSDDEEEVTGDIKKIKLSSFDIHSSDNNNNNNNKSDESSLFLKDENLADQLEEIMVSSMANNFMMMSQGSENGGIVFINGNTMMMGKNRNEEDALRKIAMPFIEEITTTDFNSVEEITTTDFNSVEEITTTDFNRVEDECKKIIVLEDFTDTDSDDEEEEEDASQENKLIVNKMVASSPRSPQIESLQDIAEPIKIIKNEEITHIKRDPTKTKVNTKAKVKKTVVTMDIENDKETSIKEETTIKEETLNSLPKTSKLEDMKVDDLRKTANERNLDTKENIKKMKKADLITLLTLAPTSADDN